MRQERLLEAISDDERQILERVLSLEPASGQTPHELEHAARRWRAWNAIPSPVALIARPARVKDRPHVIARFAAYDFAPTRTPRMDAGWFLSGYVSRNPDGGHVVSRLAIEPEHEGQPGVTSDVLRSFNPTQILAKVRAYLSTAESVELEQLPTTTRRGRPRLSDEHLAEVARLCFEESDLRGRGWLDRVAERMDSPRETVRGWVREAQRRGFLAPGQRGSWIVALGPRLRSATGKSTG